MILLGSNSKSTHICFNSALILYEGHSLKQGFQNHEET